ncbi:UNVERIFIED_CONTAM: hypothetical protein O8I53_13585 [Campylobacter lari]
MNSYKMIEKTIINQIAIGIPIINKTETKPRLKLSLNKSIFSALFRAWKNLYITTPITNAIEISIMVKNLYQKVVLKSIV